MREHVRKLIERTKPGAAVKKWEDQDSSDASQAMRKKVAMQAMRKMISDAEEKAKKEIDEARAATEEAKAALRKAEEATEAAERRKDRALEELAKAESEAEELGRERAEMEEKVERAKSKAERARDIAAAAENRRISAEAMKAEAEAARAAALNDAEASRQSKMEADTKLAESLQMMDKIRAELIGSEKSRATDARLAQVALEKARSQIITSNVLDVVPNRNDRGLITYLDVQIGTDRFRVVPVRNAAGQIVEMRREEI